MRATNTIAVAGGLAVLAFGSAAASAAGAYSITSSPGGPPVAPATTYSASTQNINLINPSNGATVMNCTSSTLSGEVGPATEASLSISSGSFSGCKTAGSNVVWAGNFSTPWRWLVNSGGGAGAYSGPMSKIRLTIGPCAYTGSLTPVTVSNGTSSSVTALVLAGAGTLTRSGCTSSIWPVTAQFTATYTLATVGGEPATPVNDLVVAGPQ